MLKIPKAYVIPADIVFATGVTYENTSAVVLTPEGETDQFDIDTGVLQRDPLALFLFIICLDYAQRSAITDFTLLWLHIKTSPKF